MRLVIGYYFVILIYSFSFSTTILASQKNILRVFAKSENIYCVHGSGETRTLTSKNVDMFPVLSPNQNIIAFVRRSKKIIPPQCSDFADTGSIYGNEIWIYDLQKKCERRLVANNFDCRNLEKQIVDPSYLKFSPDSKTLYFITSAWTTSGALHAVTIDSPNPRYIIPANSLEVVEHGEYKGYLIVNQHRYFIGGGSYDWYWLFSPQGKEEGPFGDKVEQDQKEFIESRNSLKR